MNASGWAIWVVDGVLVVAVLEAVALIAFNRLTGRGLDWRDLAANLAAGLFLMAGIRIALAGAAWPWLLGCLSGAGLAHGVDLRRRIARR